MEQKKRSPWIRFTVFVLLCTLMVLPMVLCGELLRMEQIATLQEYMGDDFLYGSAYSNTYSHYKYQVLTRRNAPVLALGDSRMLQFKAAFFKQKKDFYNASTLAVTPKAYVTALKHLPPESLPKVILFGIDHSALTKDGVYLSPFDTPGFLKDEEYKTMNMLFGYLAGDRHKKKFTYWEIMQQPSKIGIMAKQKHAGFMQDGSYYYGDIYSAPQTAQQRIEPYMERIRTGSDWFCGADEVYDETLKDYAEFADLCKEKDIELIAVVPPFSPTGYEAYAGRSDTGFLQDIDTKVAQVFESRGFEFYNYTDPETLHFTDEYFIDAFHGSDVAYLRMTQDMLDQGSVLEEYIDADALKQLDANRVSELVLAEGM